MKLLSILFVAALFGGCTATPTERREMARGVVRFLSEPPPSISLEDQLFPENAG